MAGEVLAQGMILRINGVVVENVTGWPGFGDARDFEDVTNLSSTATEKLGRLPVSGSSAIELFAKKGSTGILLATGQQDMEDAYVSGGVEEFEIELPAGLGGATYARSGIVTKFDIVANVNSGVRIATMIEWSGSWTKS